MNCKKTLITALVVISSAFANLSHAGYATVEGKIEQILTSPSNIYGGCMVKVNVNIDTLGLDCPANGWVSFSCSGDFLNKDDALRMFDTSQMAFALDKSVELVVIDTRKHNGFCTVVRTDVK